MSTPTDSKEGLPASVCSAALRSLLDTSVVLSSTEDDVTICVTSSAYEAAYAALKSCKCDKLLEAVRTAKPWIKGFENMLASSLSSDSRSHDNDRQPRRDINALLAALEECEPNDERSNRTTED